MLRESSQKPAEIRAHAGEIQEGYIALPYDYTREKLRVIAGLALLTEVGKPEPQASMSFIAYDAIKPTNGRFVDPRKIPTAFVCNGGPSTPSSIHNSVIFAGPQFVRHDVDGHLGVRTKLQVNPDSLMRDCHIACLDPTETGEGRVFSKDPYWHYGAQRDVDIWCAGVEWYHQRSGFVSPESPIMLIGSSYGAFRVVGAALELAKRGINVASIVIISGYYDASLKAYDQDEDPAPFTTSLPAIAMAHYHHANYGDRAPMYFDADSVQEEYYRFKYARDFSENEYSNALKDGPLTPRRRAEIIQRLVAFTGLPPEYIDEEDLRIAPWNYAQDRLSHKGKILSLIDSRIAFEQRDGIRIDPTLDDWEPIYKKAVLESLTDAGIDLFHEDSYRGITLADMAKWEYTGIWQEKRVHEAMEELLRLNPNIRILDFNGFYDLNCPAPRSATFWREMQRRVGNLCVKMHIEPKYVDHISHDPSIAVDSFVLPMGHQLTNWRARSTVGGHISTLARRISNNNGL